MSDRADEAKLGQIHSKLADLLEAQLDAAVRGACTACERHNVDLKVVAEAVKFLKANGITSRPTPGSPLGNLAGKLPILDPHEQDDPEE